MIRHLAACVMALVLALGHSGGATDATEDADVEIDPRNRFQEPLGALQVELRKLYPDTFGGLWVDDLGTPSIAIVGDSEDIRRSTLSHLPAGVARFETVERSESELNRLHSEIVSQMGKGLTFGTLRVAAVETDVVRNRVLVYAIDVDAVQAAELEQGLGPGVQVESVPDPVVGSACTPENCPTPLKAGLEAFQSGNFHCMAGFVMYTSASKYYWSTAGHCTGHPGGWFSTSETFQHPAGTNRGTVKWGGWSNGSEADVALIEIPSTQKGNKLCVGGTTCTVKSITSRQAAGTDYINQYVCAQRRAGQVCGSIKSLNITANVYKPGTTSFRTIYMLRHVGFSVLGGDSGGPVFSQSQTQAIGFITAGHPVSGSLYSHIDLLENEAAVLTRITP